MEASKNEKHHAYNYPLMEAFRKYGVENFDFKVVDEAEDF